MTRKIYLAGGYFSYANYGDVIQARAWIDFYTGRGFHVALIHAGLPESAAEFKHYLGPNTELIHHHSILQGNVLLNTQDVFHLYGGGYLNSEWGAQFSKLLRVFGRRRTKVISTGTQVDGAWAQDYQRELRHAVDVQWISVRDKYSRKYLGSDRSLLCDDSFLYFLDSDYHKPSLARSAPPKNIIVHFNLSDYALKPFPGPRQSFLHKVMKSLNGEDKPNCAMIEDFVRDYRRQGFGLTVLRNFPNLPDDVIEAERLFADQELLSQVKLQDTFAAENESTSFQFGISNSLHAAILMRSPAQHPGLFLGAERILRTKSRSSYRVWCGKGRPGD